MSGVSGVPGLLVMDYGTPGSIDEVEAYYTHIRRGRRPSPEQLADLVRRYDAIGGLSPLAERSQAQADALAAELALRDPGSAWSVALGHKHAAPFVEDTVGELVKRGADRVMGLVLAPHWSRGSIGEYHQRAGAAADELGVPYVGVESWHDEPAWLDALASRVRDAFSTLTPPTKVLFTAHSLPERVLDGDPYADQLWWSASEIARRAGLDRWYGWSLAWQSAGRTPEPWRGPDVADVIRDLGGTGRAASVLVCPQGFVSDHLEVLYDLDIDASRVAREAGLAFARTRSINNDPAVMPALAGRVHTMATGSFGSTPVGSPPRPAAGREP
ncbi:MAG: ferrochelatase [Acidimicrobiales bacterium]